MLIPFSKVAGWQPTQHTAPAGWLPAAPPSVGSVWGFNVTRVNQDYADDPNVDYSVWSHNGSVTPDEPHFHNQNNFGRLVFSDAVGSEKDLNEHRNSVLINVFPTPLSCKETITIEISGDNAENGILELYDIKGQKLATMRVQNKRACWRAGKIMKGLYMIRFITPTEGYTKPIVVF